MTEGNPPELYRSPELDSDSMALLGEGSGTQWAPIPNLDQFFSKVYQYYAGKGFTAILVSGFLHLGILLFTVVFSSFLLIWIDWAELLECGREDEGTECLSRAIRDDAWDGVGFFSFGYVTVFVLFLLFQLARYVHDLRAMHEMRTIFSEQLDIQDYDLQSMPWSEVCRRLIKLNEKRRMVLVKDQLTPLDIANRIMRKDNYMIAMVNKDVLKLDVYIPFVGRRPIMTKTLEWNLQMTLAGYMFDDKMQIRESFLTDVHALRRRFVIMGFVNLLLAPFILAFYFVYFFFRNADELHKKPSVVGHRSWSLLAKWRFREFNEMPHVFRRRLRQSTKPANVYVEQFPSTIGSAVAKFITFVLGALIGVFLVVGLLDDSLMHQTQVFDRSILWWLGVLASVVAVTRTFIVDEAESVETSQAMSDVAKLTHYLPHRWRTQSHTYAVYEEFTSMFQYRAVLFIQEALSVLITPAIMIFALPSCARSIVHFVREYTVNVQGLGNVCALSMFDFDTFGNSKYGAPVDGGKASRTRNGKMEKSFISFKAQHPDWAGPRAGARVIENLSASLDESTFLDGSTANLAASTASDPASSTLAGGVRRPHLADGDEDKGTDSTRLLEMSLNQLMDNLHKPTAHPGLRQNNELDTIVTHVDNGPDAGKGKERDEL